MHDAMTLFGVLAKGERPPSIPITANLPDQGPEELVIAAGEYCGSPDNVTRGQLKLLRKYSHDGMRGAPGGGFIFGTMMIPCGIPKTNIRAMIRADHESGTYIPEA
jgi:hypothetical protein